MHVPQIIRLNQLRFIRKHSFMGQFSQLAGYISLSPFLLSLSSLLSRGLVQVMERYCENISCVHVRSGISMEIKLTCWYVIILLHFAGEEGKAKDL